MSPVEAMHPPPENGQFGGMVVHADNIILASNRAVFREVKKQSLKEALITEKPRAATEVSARVVGVAGGVGGSVM